MYYALIMTAVIMFGFQFLSNQYYTDHAGNSRRAVLIFQIGCGIVGFITQLLIALINGGTDFAGFGIFTLFMALIAAGNSLAYTFCSLKALGRINLSLFSVFAMLGGMIMPFIAGVFIFSEEITLGKLISVVFIILALAVTVNGGVSKSGMGYYAGVFIFNGMNGVLSKIYQAVPLEKSGESVYMMTAAVWSVVLSLILLLSKKTEKNALDARSMAPVLGCGLLNYSGNFILLISLSHIPASAQYPIVTGGVMAVSTLLCFFTKNKPSKREMLSVLLSMIGIFAMILI